MESIVKITRTIHGKNRKEIKEKIDFMIRINGTFDFKIIEQNDTYFKIIISMKE